ncbi:MAG: gp436 family protein [Polyangiales bacterium]
MPYATVQDLVDRFGEKEILQLTDRDHTDEIDTEVAEQALDDASAEIDGYLDARRFKLPLEDVPRVLTRAAADIARYRLYATQAPETVKDRYEATLSWLKMLARGDVQLGIEVQPEARGAVSHSPGKGEFDDIEGF